MKISLLTVPAAALCILLGACTSNSRNGKGDNGEEEVKESFYPKEKGSLRLVSYNVGAFSKYMDNSTEMIAQMLKEIDADVVGLNETDSVNTRHMTFQVADLADALGRWEYYFGRAMAYKNGAYGNGVVCKPQYGIKAVYDVILPKGNGYEQRSVAVVETDNFVYGCAHLDHNNDANTNIQAELVNKWFKEKYSGCSKPVFFCGDMNMEPGSPAITTLQKDWDILSTTDFSYGSKEPTKCIDYIFHYKDSAPVTRTAAGPLTKFRTGSVSNASDHLPIYVDVRF